MGSVLLDTLSNGWKFPQLVDYHRSNSHLFSYLIAWRLFDPDGEKINEGIVSQ